MTHFYRKRPVVIEAALFKGTADSLAKVYPWITENGGNARSYEGPDGTWTIMIDTLEGTMSALAGDYVIKGVQGEFYPCKPDIFDATYEAVE